MLSEYTWGDFWLVVGSAVAIYYLIVGWVFYREDIRDFLTRDKSTKQVPSVATDTDVDDDISDMFNTVPYPSASASAEVLTQAPPKPKRERKKREKKQTPEPAGQQSEQSVANTSPMPSAPEQDQKDVDIPATPIASDVIVDTFLGDLTGTTTPLSEESVESVVEAAKDLEVQEDGSISAKPEAGAGAQRLAKLASRKSLPADLDNLPFNR